MAAKRSGVMGIRSIVKAIQKHKVKTERGYQRGVTKAGLWLLRESMKIVPVDTSALKNSAPAVTRAEGTGFQTEMIVGYGQNYAIYVHERTDLQHKPGKQAKFLETPAREGRKTMADIIKDEARK